MNEEAQYDLRDATTQLSRIINRVEQGEEVMICRAGRPVAKVVPVRSSPRRTGRGTLTGQVVAPDDWDSTDTNDAITRDFG